MNTFDVKHYEDIALAHWVRQKPVPTEKFQYEQIVWDHYDEIVERGEKLLGFLRYMRWVMFDWGWAIETSRLDEENTLIVETLISYNAKTATIVHRYRSGPNHNEMKTYQRDNLFPVSSIVRLLP